MDECIKDLSSKDDLETRKIYFDETEFTKMSDYEQKRFVKNKRNYENLVNMGLNPDVPNFILWKKRTDDAKYSVTNGEKKNGKTSRRYPKRNVPKMCYKEEDVPSEGDYLYKDKQSQLVSIIAASSSMNMHTELSQDHPCPNTTTLGYNSAYNSISSTSIPQSPKKCQPLLKSDCHNGIITVLSTKTDSGDKRTADKTDCAVFVTQENAIPLDKYAGISKEKKTDQKLYACPQCNFTTAYSSVLRRHVNGLHENKKSYKCLQCDYRASQPNDLRRHTNAVHERLIFYKCQQCEYKAFRSDHLRQHLNAVHRGIKPYRCQYCDYRASQSGSLRRHQKCVHEGIKSLKCQQCHYRTSRTDNLQQHVNCMHTEFKPYKCQHCDYRASTLGNLRRHVKSVHESPMFPSSVNIEHLKQATFENT